MIYEADKGMTLHQAAREAIKCGCDRILHDNVIYDVEFTYERLGKFVADPIPQPAVSMEFGGQSKP